MTITFVCRASKVSKKDGLTPLELYVIINGNGIGPFVRQQIVDQGGHVGDGHATVLVHVATLIIAGRRIL